MPSLKAPPLNFTPEEPSRVEGVVREEGRELIECLCGLGVCFEVGLEYLLQFPAEDRVSWRLLLILGGRGSASRGSPGLFRGHHGLAATQHYNGQMYSTVANLRPATARCKNHINIFSKILTIKFNSTKSDCGCSSRPRTPNVGKRLILWYMSWNLKRFKFLGTCTSEFRIRFSQ